MDSEGYQSDSEGYQSDSEGYQADSEGYQADGTPRPAPALRWPTDADPELRGIVEQEIESRGDDWGAECARSWERFARLADAAYGDRLLVVKLWCDGILESDDWPPRHRVFAPNLPTVELPRLPAAGDPRLSCQLNVRLREVDYERLIQAADRYGLPATTFARLLITRGVEAVLLAPQPHAGA